MLPRMRFAQNALKRISPASITFRSFHAQRPVCQSNPLPTPAEESQQASPKIQQIVDSISSLNLSEVAELVKSLKVSLNISDVVIPMTGASTSQGSGPAAEAAVEESEKPVAKTEFNIKLEKFDAASKAKIIREIKALIPGMNLVEAKKFVESAPKMIKENVLKEEADKIKAKLEELGATVVLE